MIHEHEYSVLGGLNRAAIGRYISIAAAIIASCVVTLVLALIDLAKWLGWPLTLPRLVMWPVTAGLIYAGLYWLFDRHAWKFRRLSNLLRVPNLAGRWHCAGQTINPDKTLGYTWEGEIVIVQTWDRLRIRLKTAQSSSNSIAAALAYDRADGFRLLYNYKNEPKIGEPADLAAHRGSADLTFAPDLQTAEGEYFNGHGRYTFGKMHLKRI